MECHGPQPRTTAPNWETHPKYQLKNSPYARQHNLMKSRILIAPGKKKKYCRRLLILEYFHHTVSRIPIIFAWLCDSSFCSETLFLSFLPFFRISLPIPFQALFFFFKFLFIVIFSTLLFECDASQSRSVWYVKTLSALGIIIYYISFCYLSYWYRCTDLYGVFLKKNIKIFYFCPSITSTSTSPVLWSL